MQTTSQLWLYLFVPLLSKPHGDKTQCDPSFSEITPFPCRGDLILLYIIFLAFVGDLSWASVNLKMAVLLAFLPLGNKLQTAT